MSVRAHRNGEWSARVPDELNRRGAPDQVIASVLSTINRFAAASVSAEIPIHAACVVRDGRALALAGPSGAGKSTLAAAAVLDGWGYLADEVTAIDPDTLQVRAYHRPIGLRPGGASSLGLDSGPDSSEHPRVRPWRVSGDQQLASTARLAAVVLVRRSHEVNSVEALPPAQALADLAELTFPTRTATIIQFRRAEHIARQLPAFALTYDRAAEATKELEVLLSESCR